MIGSPAPDCGALDGHCITCSDEGVAMRVVAGTDEPGVMRCVVDADSAAPAQDIDVGLVDPVQPGDVLLVHAGVALLRLRSEAEVAP